VWSSNQIEKIQFELIGPQTSDGFGAYRLNNRTAFYRDQFLDAAAGLGEDCVTKFQSIQVPLGRGTAMDRLIAAGAPINFAQHNGPETSENYSSPAGTAITGVSTIAQAIDWHAEQVSAAAAGAAQPGETLCVTAYAFTPGVGVVLLGDFFPSESLSAAEGVAA
jgi:hypothetical protein